MQRSLPVLVLLLLGVAVWWLWTTRPQPGDETSAAPTPTAQATVPTAEVMASGPPPGYRLAGLAIGEPQSFAAIELPDGNSRLYRLESDVPGLGRVVAITPRGVEIEAENGRFTLQLKPAATATPDPRRVNGAAGEPTAPPRLPDGRDDTGLEPTA